MLFNKKSKVANTLIKIILIALFFYIIYNQIFIENDAELMWKEFELTIKHGNFLFLFLAIILMAFNWGLESLKWQFMISGMEKVSFLKSLKTILIGITTGLITPLKIGDYFGRILMVENKNQWKAVWVTFIAGFAQNIATVVFGFIGLIYYFDQIYIVEDYLFYSGISLGLFFIVVLLFLYYNIDLALKIANRLGLKKIVKKISGDRDTKNLVPVIILNKVLLLSFLRYIVFSIQFYLIIIFFGINGPLFAIFESIVIIFFIQSGLPLPPIANVLARGEIAILMLSIFTDNKILILSSSFSLWIINILIPAFIGLFFIIRLDVTKSFGYD